MGQAEESVRCFQVLSSRTRVRILSLLQADEALCVGALAAKLGITQGAVSQHLRVLREAGLVVPERRGYFMHYRLCPVALNKCQSALEQLFAPAGKCSRALKKRPVGLDCAAAQRKRCHGRKPTSNRT